MRYNIFAILKISVVIAIVVTALLCSGWYWPVGLGMVALLLNIVEYRALALPLRTVENGMYLLREQDFASRLREVGEPDADKVVELFNGLMDSMKQERLKSLEQQNFLSQVIEASPAGIAICDFDGNIQSSNRAYKRMIGESLAMPALKEGESCVVRSGVSNIYRCSRHSFMDMGFRRPFYMVEQLTDEIVKAEKSVFNKVVRTMGHEVNNTLGSVISVLETLKEINGDDEVVLATLDSCCDSCVNLGKFVKGYSDVVKLPAPNLQPTDLNKVIQTTLPVLKELAGRDIAIVAEYEAPEVIADVDAMLLQRVLVNVVKNSVESICSKGSGDGEIRIRTFTVGLEIIDNGAGVSAENATKLFTPFFSTKNPDRGLGLMLIRDILRSHHARFSLATESDSLTHFLIKF